MASWRRSLTAWLEPPEAPAPTRALRASLALQELGPVLAEVNHPAVLDLGCVWQATVSFFTAAGCKVYTEDVFQRLSEAVAEDLVESPPLGERFLPGVLQYPDATFRGILAWDLFDYLPGELVEALAARLHAVLEPGGALVLLCHNRRTGNRFTRYRVADSHNLELVPGSLPLHLQRAYANRTLLNLFAAFRSSRTFVGRDNLREVVLVK